MERSACWLYCWINAVRLRERIEIGKAIDVRYHYFFSAPTASESCGGNGTHGSIIVMCSSPWCLARMMIVPSRRRSAAMHVQPGTSHRIFSTLSFINAPSSDPPQTAAAEIIRHTRQQRIPTDPHERASSPLFFKQNQPRKPIHYHQMFLIGSPSHRICLIRFLNRQTRRYSTKLRTEQRFNVHLIAVAEERERRRHAR